MVCSGRTARRAAVFSFALCKAILEGMREQHRRDELYIPGEVGLHAVFEKDDNPTIALSTRSSTSTSSTSTSPTSTSTSTTSNSGDREHRDGRDEAGARDAAPTHGGRRYEVRNGVKRKVRTDNADHSMRTLVEDGETITTTTGTTTTAAGNTTVNLSTKMCAGYVAEKDAKTGVSAHAYAFSGKENEVYHDDLTGQKLDAALVRKARRLEMDYF